MACDPCSWVRLSKTDHSFDEEAASLFIDWCPLCRSVRIIHEGDYSWWRQIYTVGSPISELTKLPLGELVKMTWDEIEALKNQPDDVIKKMAEPKDVDCPMCVGPIYRAVNDVGCKFCKGSGKVPAECECEKCRKDQLALSNRSETMNNEKLKATAERILIRSDHGNSHYSADVDNAEVARTVLRLLEEREFGCCKGVLDHNPECVNHTGPTFAELDNLHGEFETLEKERDELRKMLHTILAVEKHHLILATAVRDAANALAREPTDG